jgi:anti-anti-sigma factor
MPLTFWGNGCGCCVVEVAGVVDLANARLLRQLLAEAITEWDGVLVDLSRVDFMDSQGLHALLRAHQDHPDGVRLLATSPQVDTLLRLAGCAELFPVADGHRHSPPLGQSSARCDVSV